MPAPLFVKIRGESIDQSLTREIAAEKMSGGGAGARAGGECGDDDKKSAQWADMASHPHPKRNTRKKEGGGGISGR